MEPRRHSIPLKNQSSKDRHDVVCYDWGDVEAPHTTVCVHGLTRNAHDFDLLAEELSQHKRRVFAINMAGRGESQWLADPQEYNYSTYVADCLAIMDNFHLRSVDWVGTSMGGIIGMMIAAQHPKRIRKLVLNDIGTFLSKEALGRIFEYVRSIPRSFATRAEGDAYLAKVFEPFGITDPTLWQRFVDTSLLPQPDGNFRLACDPAIAEPVRRESKEFTELKDVNLGGLWEEITKPTLIIHGEKSDVLSADTVRAMKATNPRAESVLIAGVGHAPSLMTREQIDLLTRWLVAPAAQNLATGL